MKASEVITIIEEARKNLLTPEEVLALETMRIAGFGSYERRSYYIPVGKTIYTCLALDRGAMRALHLNSYESTEVVRLILAVFTKRKLINNGKAFHAVQDYDQLTREEIAECQERRLMWLDIMEQGIRCGAFSNSDFKHITV